MILDLKVKTFVNLAIAEIKADLILDGTLEKIIEDKL